MDVNIMSPAPVKGDGIPHLGRLRLIWLDCPLEIDVLCTCCEWKQKQCRKPNKMYCITYHDVKSQEIRSLKEFDIENQCEEWHCGAPCNNKQM
jgi:hypothetical protein